MEIKVVLDEGAYMPEKAHAEDAGFDLRARGYYIVPSNGSAVIDTGIHMEIPKGYVGMLKSKSGLNVYGGITCEGVIDAGFTGSIVAKLYNNSSEARHFEKGDKITQIVIIPIPEVELKEVDELEDTERGANGIGSTGK